MAVRPSTSNARYLYERKIQRRLQQRPEWYIIKLKQGTVELSRYKDAHKESETLLELLPHLATWLASQFWSAFEARSLYSSSRLETQGMYPSTNTLRTVVIIQNVVVGFLNGLNPMGNNGWMEGSTDDMKLTYAPF